MDEAIKEIQKQEEPELVLNKILTEIQNQVSDSIKNNTINTAIANQKLKDYSNELLQNTYNDIFIGALFGFVYEKSIVAKRNNNDFSFEIERYFLEIFGTLNKNKLRSYFFTPDMIEDSNKALHIIESIPEFVDEEYKNLKPKKLRSLLIKVSIVLAFLGYYPKDLLVKCKKENNKKLTDALNSIIRLP